LNGRWEQVDAQDLKPLIEEKIVEVGFAKDSEGANEIFMRLFAYIFHMLSSDKEKRLDKKLLIDLIQRGSIATADKELLKGIWDYIRISKES